MKIKNVAELVGITGKNIRFYEEQGLLSPKRASNGYREYDQEDINLLLKIKLFRKLGIPIEDIKRIFEGILDVNTCLDQNLSRLEKEKNSLDKMQEVSEAIMAKKLNLQNLNPEEYLDEIERLEKGGVSFMALDKTDMQRKKRKGAIGATIAVLAFILCYIAICVWGMMTDPVPIWVAVVIIGIALVVIVGIILALIGRMKEIEGGEEDEAAKY